MLYNKESLPLFVFPSTYSEITISFNPDIKNFDNLDKILMNYSSLFVFPIYISNMEDGEENNELLFNYLYNLFYNCFHILKNNFASKEQDNSKIYTLFSNILDNIIIYCEDDRIKHRVGNYFNNEYILKDVDGTFEDFYKQAITDYIMRFNKIRDKRPALEAYLRR